MAHDLHMAPWDLFWWLWQVLPAMWMERMAWVEPVKPVEPWHLHLDFAAEALEAASWVEKYQIYEIHETCFALKALRFSPFNFGKVSSMCIALPIRSRRPRASE